MAGHETEFSANPCKSTKWSMTLQASRFLVTLEHQDTLLIRSSAGMQESSFGLQGPLLT